MFTSELSLVLNAQRMPLKMTRPISNTTTTLAYLELKEKDQGVWEIKFS